MNKMHQDIFMLGLQAGVTHARTVSGEIPQGELVSGNELIKRLLHHKIIDEFSSGSGQVRHDVRCLLGFLARRKAEAKRQRVLKHAETATLAARAGDMDKTREAVAQVQAILDKDSFDD